MGATVKLSGLHARPELNGQTGHIVSFLPERQRFLVKLQSSGDIALKSSGDIALKASSLSLVCGAGDKGEDLNELKRAAIELGMSCKEAKSKTAIELRSFVHERRGKCKPA